MSPGQGTSVTVFLVQYIGVYGDEGVLHWRVHGAGEGVGDVDDADEDRDGLEAHSETEECPSTSDTFPELLGWGAVTSGLVLDEV